MALAATVVHLVATVAHLVASVAVGKQQRLPAGLLASAQLGLPPLRSGWPPGYCARQSRPPWLPAACSPLIPATAGAILLAGAGRDKRASGPPV